jgi:putative zinc finger protein
MNDLLPEYAAGSLGPADRRRVEEHVAGCADCRADLASWRVLARAANQVDAADAAPPGPEVVRDALLRSALTGPPPAARIGVRFVLALLRAEARLVRASVLVASALVMAFGAALAAAVPSTSGGPGSVLMLVAPIVAALGIASVYGPQRDPVYELTAAAPTPPRLVLLARVVLVFAYDLVLALATSGLLMLAGSHSVGMVELVLAWLGPMALLSALSLFVAVWTGPEVAVGAALAVWALRVLADSVFAGTGGPFQLVRVVWSTGPVTMLVVCGLTVAAVIVAGRGEPARRLRATHPT